MEEKKYIFEQLETNINSIKLAENLGMHLESIREDDYFVDGKYYNHKVYTIVNK